MFHDRCVFFKYQGTGNDFIILDNFQNSNLQIPDKFTIEKWCDRHFGIGADGLMVIAPSERYDFKMIYFNSDGNKSSMCGNGGRCIVALAHKLGYVKDVCTFEAADGLHTGSVLQTGEISISMNIDSVITSSGSDYIVNTGSPHYVRFIDETVDSFDIFHFGRSIRYNERFANEGINVNAVFHVSDSHLEIRTYERGVENETLSCGTGVTAAALSYLKKMGLDSDPFNFEIRVDTKGGTLYVKGIINGSKFSDIHLQGPAEFVFVGEI